MNRISLAVSLFLTSVVTAPLAVAAPQVSGSTISWPDDGWYQVLSADDYSEICGGGSSCDVSPGRYIVINHSTGQRFENVVVREESASSGGVSVSGNTLSWPDDGWYQVQNANDYTTVCEGVRQCDVDDGVYNVINHTTGRRFDGIEVMAGGGSNGSGGSEPPSDPVAGNGFPAGEIPIPMNARLDEAAPYLIESLAGYQLEQAQIYIETLGQAIVSTALVQVALAPSSVSITANDIVQQIPNQRTEYGCQGGGSMIREVAFADVDEPGYSEDDTIDGWRFVQCRINADAGELLGGEHVLNGFVSLATKIVSGNRFNTLDQVVRYAGFSLTAPGFNRLLIDASATVDVYNSFDTGSTRSVFMNRYAEVRDGRVLRDIRNAEFQFFASDEGGGSFQVRSASMYGRILGTVTRGRDVAISTIEALERTSVISEEFASARVPFRGQMQISAVDGTEMGIAARAGAPEFDAPLLYDYSLLSANGETTNGERQSLPAFAIFAPEQAFYQR